MKTDISILLDRSGSMEPIQQATIESINGFVARQDNDGTGDTFISLVQFDDKYEPNYSGVHSSQVVPLNTASYQPRGGTALLNAIVRAIEATQQRLNFDEQAGQKADAVLFVIQTDGQENSSHIAAPHATYAQVQKLQAEKEAAGWEFLFLGANVDAIAEAAKLGIKAGKAIQYGHNTRGTKAVYAAAMSNVGDWKRRKNEVDAMACTPDFTDSQRLAAKADDENDDEKTV